MIKVVVVQVVKLNPLRTLDCEMEGWLIQLGARNAAPFRPRRVKLTSIDREAERLQDQQVIKFDCLSC